MYHPTKLLLSTAIVLTLLLRSLAQQSPTLPPETRSVVVNVVDAHGNAVRDLTREDFRVSVNGKQIPVLDARFSLAPRRIVVLVDMSGSMTEGMSKKWQITQHAIDDLLTQTPRDVPIALLAFAADVRDVFDFSQSRAAIDRWLKEGPGQQPKLKYPAKTALFDAILRGLTLLDPVQKGDAIYAVTDGGDNASAASAERTKAALGQAGVRLFAFFLAQTEPIVELEEKKDFFLNMVNASGGFVFGVTGRQKPYGSSWDTYYVYDHATNDKIAAVTTELNILVNGFWTVDLAPCGLTKKSRMKLELVDRNEKARRDVMLLFPRELYPAR